MEQRPAIFFDLDGTLLDSLAAIADCCNRALSQFGYPTHDTERYREFVGHGADVLMHRALPNGVEGDEFARFKSCYMELYLESCRDGGILFPGVTELLDWLHEQGVLAAAVSNKPYEPTNAVCQKAFGKRLDGWLGQHPDIALKPDPAGVRRMEQQLGARCIAYVGDSDVDVQTGHNAGVPTVAVSWGMQPRQRLVDAEPDCLADDFNDLKQFLLDIITKWR